MDFNSDLVGLSIQKFFYFDFNTAQNCVVRLTYYSKIVLITLKIY